MEILAPAGSYEQMVANIESGCNAVYGGLKNYNARNKAKNFTIEMYNKAIDYCNEHNIAFYLVLNTSLLDSEIQNIIELFTEKRIKYPNAIIISDIGLMRSLRNSNINIDIHFSTQFGAHNLNDIKFLEQLDVKRVILAREVTLDELQVIRENTGIEIEIFVWGSQCMAFSGQCFWCSMISGGSGNRGKCIALCRDNYGYGDKINGQLLYPNDLNVIGYSKKFMEMGINSLKIEGRRREIKETTQIVKLIKKSLYNEGNMNTKVQHSYLEGKIPVLDFTTYVNKRESLKKEKTAVICRPIKFRQYNVSLQIVDNKNNGLNSVYIINDNGEGKIFSDDKNNCKKVFSTMEELIKKFEDDIDCLNIYKICNNHEHSEVVLTDRIIDEIYEYLSKKVNEFKSAVIELRKIPIDISKIRVDITMEQFQAIPDILSMGIKEVIVEVNDVDDLSLLKKVNVNDDRIIYKLGFYAWNYEKERKLINALKGKKIMITRLSQLMYIKEAKRVECDYTINCWNTYMVDLLIQKGVTLITLNPELDFFTNMKIYNNKNVELEQIFLGDVPMLSTRHCFRNVFGCQGKCSEIKNIENTDKSLKFKMKCNNNMRTLYYEKKTLIDGLNADFSTISHKLNYRYIARLDNADEIIRTIKNLANNHELNNEDYIYRNKYSGRI